MHLALMLMNFHPILNSKNVCNLSGCLGLSIRIDLAMLDFFSTISLPYLLLLFWRHNIDRLCLSGVFAWHVSINFEENFQDNFRPAPRNLIWLPIYFFLRVHVLFIVLAWNIQWKRISACNFKQYNNVCLVCFRKSLCYIAVVALTFMSFQWAVQ